MLLAAEVDSIPEKRGCKRNLIWPGGFSGSKVVFTLLTEVVALHVGPTVVDIRGLGLELIFRRSTL